MWKPIVAISLGASLGALLRWWLGTRLNSHFPSVPPGTLTANLLGGYIIGVATAIFGSASALAPEWRLLVMTGFCGGLTMTSARNVRSVAMRARWRPPSRQSGQAATLRHK